MTFSEIVAIHPIPWRHQTRANVVQILDARGAEVQLFTVLQFVVNITEQLAAKSNTSS